MHLDYGGTKSLKNCRHRLQKQEKKEIKEHFQIYVTKESKVKRISDRYTDAN